MATKRLKQTEDDSSINNGDETDRLSALPDHLLQHIFSFVPTLSAVQTCLCIKSLQHIWRSIPSLDFNDTFFLGEYPPSYHPDFDELVNGDGFDEFFTDEYPPYGQPDFYEFINTFMLLRDNSEIEKLLICCGQIRVHDGESVSKINDGIISAMRRSIRALDLEVSSSYAYASSEPFQMTHHILNCPSLRELKLNLNGFRINFPTSICLPVLRTLHLKRIKYYDHCENEALFSQSPVLENLVIEYCDFNEVKPLKISAQQLKHLTIMGMLPHNTTISTPNLVSLKLHDNPGNKFSVLMDRRLLESSLFFVDNLIHLAEADINVPVAILHILASRTRSVVTESSLQLIGALQNAQSLTLCHLFIKSYAFLLKKKMYILEHLRIPFCNLKWLKVETYFYDSYILLINTLLKHSPNIKTLILENLEKFGDPPFVKAFEVEELEFSYELLHLKSVCFQNFKGGMNEVKFVRYLLENSVALQKLVVVVPCCENPNRKTIEELLLKMPHASQSVEILVK